MLDNLNATPGNCFENFIGGFQLGSLLSHNPLKSEEDCFANSIATRLKILLAQLRRVRTPWFHIFALYVFILCSLNVVKETKQNCQKYKDEMWRNPTSKFTLTASNKFNICGTCFFVFLFMADEWGTGRLP